MIVGHADTSFLGASMNQSAIPMSAFHPSQTVSVGLLSANC
jgi:hypothetical protein